MWRLNHAFTPPTTPHQTSQQTPKQIWVQKNVQIAQEKRIKQNCSQDMDSFHPTNKASHGQMKFGALDLQIKLFGVSAMLLSHQSWQEFV